MAINQVKYYKILRIRMKISYHAWTQNTTVKQLFLQQIMESYQSLRLESFKVLNIKKLCSVTTGKMINALLKDKFESYMIDYMKTKPNKAANPMLKSSKTIRMKVQTIKPSIQREMRLNV